MKKIFVSISDYDDNRIPNERFTMESMVDDSFYQSIPDLIASFISSGKRPVVPDFEDETDKDLNPTDTRGFDLADYNPNSATKDTVPMETEKPAQAASSEAQQSVAVSSETDKQSE